MAEPENNLPKDFGRSLLNQIADNVRERFEIKEQLKAFADFLDSVQQTPWLHTRSAAQYVKDCFDYFGHYTVNGVTGPIRRFKLFDLSFSDDEVPVFGQEVAQNQIYAHLCSFADRGVTDKILVLHGPNGTGKTSLVKAMMRALEHYSHQPEGLLYTFNWVFSDNTDRSGFGFQSQASWQPGDSFALLDAESISVKLPSDLRDNPLLLLPAKERREFLEKAYISHGRKPQLNRNILFGDISHKSRRIYNELLTSYHGDWVRVMQHVQITRFYVSRRYRRCAVTIEPQRNIDASVRPINIDSSFQLPPVLHQTEISELAGDLIDGNRGVVEYSDFFKRPMEVNKYLLTTSEQGTISVGSTLAFLDVLLIATSNEMHLRLMRADPDFGSFKARMEFVRVPYVLQWTKEANFYATKLPAMARGKDIGPHCAKVLGLWAVLTRLKKPRKDLKLYSGQLRLLVERMTAVEKANLYDSSKPPMHWRDTEKQELLAAQKTIAEEFDDFEDIFEKIKGPEYEGRRGISAREMLTLINEASLNKSYSSLSGLTVLDTIREFCRDRNQYDFLRLDLKRTYGPVSTLTDFVEQEFLNWVTQDFRDSTQLISDEEYERLFQDYFVHVKALQTQEKIIDPKTGQQHEANLDLLREVEDLVGVTDAAEFRNSLTLRIASWALDNVGKAVDYREIFADIFENLKQANYERRAQSIRTILTNLLKYQTDAWQDMSANDQSAVENCVANLKSKHGYTLTVAKEVASWLLSQDSNVE